MKLALQIIGGIAVVCAVVVLGAMAYSYWLVSALP